MKIALITDIHHNSPSARQPDWVFLEALSGVIDRFNDIGAGLLIDLGDRISDRGAETDRAALREIADILRRFRGPRLHLMGNHDVETLSFEETAGLLGEAVGHRVLGFDGWRVIAWQPSTRLDPESGFAPASADLPWLIDALRSDPRPAIIATHVPVSGQSMAGNYYFENHAGLSTYPDHAAIRTAVEQTGRAAIWLSGHVHCNSMALIRGIAHLTMQSFSERATAYPSPAGAYGILDIGDKEFGFQVFGRDPMSLRLPFHAADPSRYPPPLPGK